MILGAGCLFLSSHVIASEVIPGPIGEVTSLGAAGLAFFLLWWIVVKQRPAEMAANDARIEAAEKRAQAHAESIVALVSSRFDAAIERQHQDTSELAKSVCDRFDAVVRQQHEDTLSLGMAIKSVADTIEKHYAVKTPIAG